MNRLGFKFSEIDLIKQMISLDNIKFLMTHLSSADEKNINECRSQLSEIKKINNNITESFENSEEISNKILNNVYQINGKGRFYRIKHV